MEEHDQVEIHCHGEIVWDDAAMEAFVNLMLALEESSDVDQKSPDE